MMRFLTGYELDSGSVLIKPIRSDQSPMEWAQDEATMLTKKNVKILAQPKNMAYGKARYVKMVSEIHSKNNTVRFEQDFISWIPGRLIEVAVSAPPAAIERERSAIESFLGSYNV